MDEKETRRLKIEAEIKDNAEADKIVISKLIEELNKHRVKQLLELRRDEVMIRTALDALRSGNPLTFEWKKRSDLLSAPYVDYNLDDGEQVRKKLYRLRMKNSGNQKLVEAQVEELLEEQKSLRDEAKDLQKKLELCKINAQRSFGDLEIKQLPPLKNKSGQQEGSKRDLKELFDGWKEILESHQAIKEEMTKTIAEFKSQLSQLQQDSKFMQELRDKNEALLQDLREQQGLLAVHDAFKNSSEGYKKVNSSYLTPNKNPRFVSDVEKTASDAIAREVADYESKKHQQLSQKDDIDDLLDTNTDLQTKMISLREKMQEALSDKKFTSFVLGHKSESERPSSSRLTGNVSHSSRPESARPKSSQSASADVPSAASRGSKSSPLDAAAQYLKSTLFQPPR